MLNYTTTIAAAKTIGEMQNLLGRAGASAVAVRYHDKEPAGLSFTLTTAIGERAYTMPVNVEGVAKVLRHDPKTRNRSAYTSPEQATRVAWRVVKDWLEAQLAIIDANMASLDQVMLPYLHVDGDKTLYEAFRDKELLAIEAGAA